MRISDWSSDVCSSDLFSMLANHGRALTPHLIDYVQDRRGKVIFPKNWKACEGCNTPDWNGRPMPRFAPSGKQLMDPLTAYQVVHMLAGVVQRGTAQRLRDLGVTMFGNTGTRSEQRGAGTACVSSIVYRWMR